MFVCVDKIRDDYWNFFFFSKCRNLLSFLPSRGFEGMVNEIRYI